MSGIVGSKLNIRGSGLVGSLGTDGQHLLSAGAGKSNVFETVAGGGGKIGQVVSTLKTDSYTCGTSASWTDITGMSRAITPSASDSTILVIVHVNGSATLQTPTMKIVRDIGGGGYADTIAIGDAASSRTRSTIGTFHNGSDAGQGEVLSMTFLDSPNTTSAVTYKIQTYQDNTAVLGINRSKDDTDGTHRHRQCSTITCMEVLA